MRLFRYLALALFGIAALGASRVHAQGNPRQILVGMILQLQTATPEPAWYGEQVWQTVITQAGIPALRKLGPVQDIFVARQQQLPRGSLYSMTAQHSKGQSAWLLGISSTSNRIEYADFDVVAPVAAPLLPNPSDACKKFPKLC
jgi:hypothetical protein